MRHIRNRQQQPEFKPVSECEIAPDHYADPDQIEKWPYHDTARDFRQFSIPYKAGDVVWIDHGKEPRKAIITNPTFERGSDGFLRAKYQVHLANKKGDQFARNWFYTWPGFIERGYKLAAQLTAEPK